MSWLRQTFTLRNNSPALYYIIYIICITNYIIFLGHSVPKNVRHLVLIFGILTIRYWNCYYSLFLKRVLNFFFFVCVCVCMYVCVWYSSYKEKILAILVPKEWSRIGPIGITNVSQRAFICWEICPQGPVQQSENIIPTQIYWFNIVDGTTERPENITYIVDPHLNEWHFKFNLQFNPIHLIEKWNTL